jgi:hypothetical protein
LRDEVRALGRRVGGNEGGGERTWTFGTARKRVLALVQEKDPISQQELLGLVPLTQEQLQVIIDSLRSSEDLHLVDGKLSKIPF